MKAKFGGTCEVNPEHKWDEGSDIFMWPKSGSWEDKTKGWILCSNKDCFIAQGGKIQEQKSGGGKWQSQKFTLENAKPLMEMTEKYLDEFMAKHQPKSTTPLKIEDKIVFVESIFRTLSQNFKA